MVLYSSTGKGSSDRCACRPAVGWTFEIGLARLIVLLAVAWPLAATSAGSAATTSSESRMESVLRPYAARYAFYRNGRLTGKVEVSLQLRGGRWVLRSALSGTHGLARILAARDDEEASGHLFEGQLRPQEYTRHTRVAGIDDYWHVKFDWSTRQVSIAHDSSDDPLVLDMTEDTLDPLSLKLEMRHRLARPDSQLHFQMVEEDEIDVQRFRLLPSEWMETSLGCLLTVPVEKIRDNSKRYTRAWHAPDLGYIEVRMEHGKTGGNQIEMRITELSIDGADVLPRPGCAALQALGSPDADPRD